MIRTHVPIVNRPKPSKIKSRLVRGKGIRIVTARRIKINRIYKALKDEFLKLHPYCQHFMSEHGLNEEVVISNQGSVVHPGLRRYVYVPRSAEIHHKKGRGKYMLVTSTWMAVRP